MIAYADTNFFTRLYLSLAESETAARLLERAGATASPPLPITWLHRLEILNAFQLHVFRGKAAGHVRVTQEQAAGALANFRTDMSAQLFLRKSDLPAPELERAFEELTLRHTANHGFRTYDIVHVASALLLGCDTFWSFDQKASKLAELEGLKLRE